MANRKEPLDIDQFGKSNLADIASKNAAILKSRGQEKQEVRKEDDTVNHEGEFESERDEDDDDDDDESLDGLNIDKDEDIQQLLIELNDTAIQALKNEDNDNSLECLKRGEQLLEAVTAEGKDVDRNLIIVILYNLGCTYQRMSMLEDCASYLDGTIYNLEAKVTNFDDNESIIQMMLQTGGNTNIMNSQQSIQSQQQQQQQIMPNVFETTKKFNISSKLFKLRYMCKCHLQLCAVLSQLNKHSEALYHGQMASLFCQELIKNTHLLCKSYIQKLLQEKNQKKVVLKDIENEVNDFDKSLSDSDKDNFGRRTSYYVEENEKILNLLITNCEPILSEIVQQVNHFNTYNKITKIIEKSQSLNEELNIGLDCQMEGPLFNAQKLFMNAQTNANNNIPNTIHSNYNKLKNTYITQIKSKPVVTQQNKVKGKMDDVVPEELEKKKKIQLNESTYYNTKGIDGEPQSQNYFSQLRNNVKTILGVKEQDDWIFNLNIGNVMHLLPMSLEELNLHIDNSHELSRDAMLEKIILLSVSYFCVGTELRFLSSQNKEQKATPAKTVYGEIPNPDQKFTKADSEMWHAMALETSGTFLPSECPLVSHVIMSYQKHHSPAMTTIPEDEPLIEQLKVVRPLNEVKNDQVNYHQIIRAYNQEVYPVLPIHHQQPPESKISSRKSSRPGTGKDRNFHKAYIGTGTANGNDFFIRKKPYPDIDLDLIEPDDNPLMIHNSDKSEKVSNRSHNYPIAFDSPQQQQQQQNYVPESQKLFTKIIQSNYNSHQAVLKPPVSQQKLSNNQQQLSRNNNQYVKTSVTTVSSTQKRPNTAKYMVPDLNQRFMQTLNQGIQKLTQDRVGVTRKSSSRLSSAGGKQRSNNNSQQRTKTPIQMSSPKQSQQQQQLAYALSGQKKGKKVLLTQRVAVESQNLGVKAAVKKKAPAIAVTSTRPTVRTPTAQQQIHHQQILLQSQLQNLLQNTQSNQFLKNTQGLNTMYSTGQSQNSQQQLQQQQWNQINSKMGTTIGKTKIKLVKYK